MTPSDRFTELLSLYLDAGLTKEQEAELLKLLDQPDLQRRFLELARMDRELAGLLATPVADDVMASLVRQDIELELRIESRESRIAEGNPQSAIRNPQSAIRNPRLLLSLAAVVLIAVGLVLWGSLGNRASAFVPVVKQSQGTVHVIGSEGRTAASAGQALLPGQQLVTGGEGSMAIVEYGDSTRLELGPDSSVSPVKNGGKRLFLGRGTLNVEAVPQPVGQPMVVQTPHAEVVVLGTRFTVESEAEATLIEVAKGSVQFTRSADRKSIEVGPGSFAVASPAVEKFASQPLAGKATGRTINLSRGIRLNHKGGVATLAFSPDSKLLASATWSDGTIRLWPVTGQASDSIALTGHTGAVWSVAFARDGQTLASGGVDKAVRLWDVPGRKLRATLEQTDHIRAVAFAPDGSLLATAGFDSSVRLRDPGTGQERSVIRENDRGGWAGIYALAFAPDSKTLAVGISDRAVRLHDVAGAVRFSLSGHSDAVRSVALSPDGKLLASASNNEIILWNTTTGQQLHRLTGAAPVAFSADGRFLASGGAAPALWGPASGAEWARLQGQRGEVYALTFSPDRKWLALGAWTGITLVDLPAALEAADKSGN